MSSVVLFFFQAEDGIRDLVRSRGLGDVYKRQLLNKFTLEIAKNMGGNQGTHNRNYFSLVHFRGIACLLYTSDAADERSSVDLGGRRIIKKKSNPLKKRRRRNTIN